MEKVIVAGLVLGSVFLLLRKLAGMFKEDGQVCSCGNCVNGQCKIRERCG